MPKMLFRGAMFLYLFRNFSGSRRSLIVLLR